MEGRGNPFKANRLGFYGGCFLAAMAVEFLTGAHAWTHVLHGGLIDPDSYMRLLRIDQGMQHGHLANMVLRDDSGVPLIIEWSRLFDAFIVALAVPLVPFLGWHQAVLVAGIATGPLSAGLLGASLAFAARPLGGGWSWTAAVIGLLLPGIHGFAGFGIVHYHIAQLALVALTSGFVLRLARGLQRAAWPAGIAGGIAIWMMPETMPFVLLAYGALFYLWLFRPIGAAIGRVGAGFAVCLIAALLIDPPRGGIFVPEIDRLSIVYAMLGVAVGAGAVWLAWLDRQGLGRTRRGVGGICGAASAFILWLAAYPSVALGPFALVPVAEMKQFFGHMSETQPVRGFPEFALLLLPGCFALIYAGVRLWQARLDPVEAGAWAILGFGILLSLGLTARFVIFQQYPAGFAAALLPVALNDISRRFASWPQRAAGFRVGIIGGMLLMPYSPNFVQAAYATTTKEAPPRQCSMRTIAVLLKQAAGDIVLTPVDDVPELLYRTRIIGVGSLYQHGIAGFSRAQDAWNSAVTQGEPSALVATGARYVLVCSHTSHEHSGAKNTLKSILETGRNPRFLSEIGHQGGFRLYRIRPNTVHLGVH